MDTSRDFDQALQQCSNHFSPPPEWMVLSDSMGAYLGNWFPSAAHIELDRVTALAAAAAGHHERRAMELTLGKTQYGVTIGETGFDVVAFLDNDWVVTMQFAKADMPSLLNVLQRLSDALHPLLQLSRHKS